MSLGPRNHLPLSSSVLSRVAAEGEHASNLVEVGHQPKEEARCREQHVGQEGVLACQHHFDQGYSSIGGWFFLESASILHLNIIAERRGEVVCCKARDFIVDIHKVSVASIHHGRQILSNGYL